MLFGQSRFSAKTANVAIRLPVFQLPRIDNVVPLAKDEAQTEFMTTYFRCCVLHDLAHLLARNNTRMSSVPFEHAACDGINGPNVDPFT